MDHALETLLQKNRTVLEDALHGRLSRPEMPHYAQLGRVELGRRIKRLVDSFLESLAQSPASFIRHVRWIADERLEQGFSLAEVQTALNTLEETAWILVSRNSKPEHQVGYLSRITYTVGVAKDALAQMYVEFHQSAGQASGQRAPLTEDLLRGTVAAPLID